MNEPEFIRRLIDKPARKGEASVVYAGPSDRVLRRLTSMQYRRRFAEAHVLPQEHTIGAAWQPQLSTGILGALVPSCPDGVGVLSF
ncbi:hypothetical protein ACFC3F_15085, partial [Microbacterium sp. NPDC055910]|uniref:hypothetical protein n=1 Tax=Microbacterium sp. NPDC055910 TaxID=3345659 RepID=UPI0035D938AD